MPSRKARRGPCEAWMERCDVFPAAENPDAQVDADVCFGSKAAVEHGEVLFMRSSPCANNALLGTRAACSVRSPR